MIVNNVAYTMNTMPTLNGATANTTTMSMSMSMSTTSHGAQRRAQRRLHIGAAAAAAAAAAVHTADDGASVVADKGAADDLSFYDMSSPHSSRSCTSSPCMDMDMYSPQSSPEHPMLSIRSARAEHSLIHPSALADYSSRDSGYGPSSTAAAAAGHPAIGSGHSNNNNSTSASSALSAGTSGNRMRPMCFKFAEPSGVAPKASPPKLAAAIHSANAVVAGRSPPQSSSCFRPFNSVGTDSVDSMDDDYMDLLDMEASMDDESGEHSQQHNSHLPSHFSSIISAPLLRNSTSPVAVPVATSNHSTITSTSNCITAAGAAAQRAPLRRCLSLLDNRSPQRPLQSAAAAGSHAPKTPQTPELMSMLLSKQSLLDNNTTPLGVGGRAFKRPEAPAFSSPTHSKRFKAAASPASLSSSSHAAGKENQPSPTPLPMSATVAAAAAPTRHLIRKSISMNDASIMSALARSSTEPDLIGDFSKPFALPLMEGRHRDLKSISAATMAKLLRGDYAEQVASFRVIDCRYPYEFEGGHIAGAENLYTQEDVLRELVHPQAGRQASVSDATTAPTATASGTSASNAGKRHIVVFHCEFSSERGPKLSRFLRNHDRQCNTNVYPALHYPEVYLLHGGYKEFYEQNAALCAPIAYRPMLDPAYGVAYKHFRAQTKSWSGGEPKPTASGVPSNRLMKSRSRLVL